MAVEGWFMRHGVGYARLVDVEAVDGRPRHGSWFSFDAGGDHTLSLTSRLLTGGADLVRTSPWGGAAVS